MVVSQYEDLIFALNELTVDRFIDWDCHFPHMEDLPDMESVQEWVEFKDLVWEHAFHSIVVAHTLEDAMFFL